MKNFIKWGLIGLVGLIILGAIFGKDEAKAAANTESVEDITVVQSSQTNTEQLSTTHVEIKNNTAKLLTAGSIKVIYKNKEGQIVGTGNGAILNLPAGQTKVVDCLAMDVVGYATYEIEPEAMLYE